MNKSKFLKKSLAMVLAIMMVVAMIPLSASAAATIDYFTVNNVEAKVEGNTITAEVPNDTVMSTIKLGGTLTEAADVAWVNKDNTSTPIGTGITTFGDVTADMTTAKIEGNVYTITINVSNADPENTAGVTTAYTLNVTKVTTPTSNVATLAKVQNDADSDNLANMVKYNIGTDKVTITMPFADSFVANNVVPNNFVTTDSGAEVTDADENGVVVQAANGSIKIYDLVIEYQDGFTAFSVEGQTKSTIDGQDITIKAPYGYDFSSGIATTFTHGSNIKAVTSTNTAYNQDVINSGDKIVYVNDTKKTIYVWTSTAGPAIPVDVTITAEPLNPEAKITDIQVTSTANGTTYKSNTVTVSGTAVTVEMPNTYKFNAAADIKVTASTDATVTVPAQNKTAVAGLLSGVDISSKNIKIRVVSQDTKTTTDYTVTFTNAAASEAKITDVTLKKSGEDTAYTAVINGTTITLTTPYALINDTNIADYTLYVTHSVGATVSTGGTVANGGTALTLPIAAVEPGTDGVPEYDATEAWTVEADDGTVQTYNFTLKHDAPKTAQTASAAEMVNNSNPDAVTVTHDASVKKVTNASEETVNAIQVSVPYSFEDQASQDVWFSKLTLSEGAKAYAEVTSGVWKEITAISADETANGFELPVLTVDTNGVVDVVGNAVELYVVSEQINVNIASDAVNGTTVKDNGNLYYVYGVARAAETGATLRSVKSTLDEKVTASLSGNTINITVPYSYDKANNSGTETPFTLNFDLSTQATLEFDSNPITGDNGTEAGAETATKFFVDGGELKSGATTFTSSGEGAATVTSENEKNINTYTVKVTVTDAKTEANLVSVKVNNSTASISGKNVTVTLPYGSNLNPVTLALTASDMAAIEVNGAPYNADANYDLNNAITIKVTSEDEKTSNTYTLTGTVATQFSDVSENDWYYDYVMQAAAAGWVLGTGDGKFSPRLNVTRQDFSVMVVRMLGVDVSSYTTSAFKDVDASHYASASIAYLADQKVVNGDASGNFRPTSNITRQEAAKIMAEALDLTGTTDKVFTDANKIAAWAKPYVDACVAAGVMNGDAAGTFRPTANITRAEAAKVIVDGAKVK